MMTLTEIIATLKDELARMPRIKLGSRWHLDRALALVGALDQLRRRHPAAVTMTPPR